MSTVLTEPLTLSQSLESAMLQALPVGVLHLNSLGCVSYANAQAQRWLPAPLLQQPWCDICARSFSAQLDEGYLCCHGGEILAISTSPLDYAPGQLIVLTDVTLTHTQQKTIDRQARLIAMGEMMARLAHQVRTPIAAAVLYLSQLRRRRATPESAQNYVARCLERLFTIEGMVRDMLMFTQSASGDSDWVDLQGWLGGVCREFEQMAALREVDFQWQSAAEGELDIQATAMASALFNLLDNAALHADSQSPCVRLQAELTTKGFFIRVDDNGPGVAREYRERILEPFFTTRGDGTGLGLPVVQSVLHSLNGALLIEDAPAGGARFVMSLPLDRFRKKEAQ